MTEEEKKDRDIFAGMALHALLSKSTRLLNEDIVRESYKIGNLMMKVRNE